MVGGGGEVISEKKKGKCSKLRSKIRREGSEIQGRGGGGVENFGKIMQTSQIPSHNNSTYQI